MKNRYIYKLMLLAIALTFAGCQEEEPITFGDSIGSFAGESLLSVNETSGTQALIIEVSQTPTEVLTFDLVIQDSTAERGVDYQFNSSTVTIQPGSYSDTIRYEVLDNEDVDGTRIFTVTFPESVPFELAVQSVKQVSIIDNDFFCPRNILADVITTELDVGFGTGPASISAVGEKSPECLQFRITSGCSSFFGEPPLGTSYVVALEEDAPDSNTGLVVPAASTGLNTNDGRTYTGIFIEISGGRYDMTAPFLEVDYIISIDDDPGSPYAGTFRYDN